MTTQIALIRAINVGGRTVVPMAGLRALAGELELGEAKTVLQSGNLILASPGTAGAKLEALLETAIAERFGYKTEVLVRSLAQWEKIIAANPFADEARDDPSHLLVMPLKDAPAASAVKALQAAIKGREIGACKRRGSLPDLSRRHRPVQAHHRGDRKDTGNPWHGPELENRDEDCGNRKGSGELTLQATMEISRWVSIVSSTIS